MEKDHTKIRAAILLVSVALLVFYLAHSRSSAPAPEAPAAVLVEVKGNVSKPGIYMFDSTSATVAFAAATAGCSSEIPADIGLQKLVSGQSLEILRHEMGTTIRFGRMQGPALLACGLKLDLNSASLDELLLIPRMRPAIAAAIIERRREKEWEKTDDLIEIRGVGLKTAQKLQDYLETSPHNK
jgi:competence protein ComEA